MNLVFGAASSALDLSSMDFSIVGNTYQAVIVAVGGAVIGIIAVKKGWSFFKGQIKAA